MEADLKSVGRLAMVEAGLASLLSSWLGPPVHAVDSFPPPIRGPEDESFVEASSDMIAIAVQTEQQTLGVIRLIKQA